MEEAPQETGGHAARLAEASTPINVVKIEFPERVLEGFRDLVKAVHGRKDFDGHRFAQLERLATGNPISVGEAMTAVGDVAEETGRHVHATGNVAAKNALNEVLSEMEVLRAGTVLRSQRDGVGGL